MLLSGCHIARPAGTTDNLIGEGYPDAESYQTSAFTCSADEIKAVEVYWRSGEVEITETDEPELHAEESGGELFGDTAMHCLLADGVLKIRFCGSGAKIRVNAADKHLRLEVPAGIDLSVHTTSALVKADALSPNRFLVAAFSGSTELGTVTAASVELSSSSGSIHADNISAQSLTCSAFSGSVAVGAVTAAAFDCTTSSGSVTADSMVSESAQITTSSGSAELALNEAPSAEIHTSSGTVRLSLPEEGAEVLYASSSGKLLTSRTYEEKGDLCVFGSGESSITVETSSGNLEIK